MAAARRCSFAAARVSRCERQRMLEEALNVDGIGSGATRIVAGKRYCRRPGTLARHDNEGQEMPGADVEPGGCSRRTLRALAGGREVDNPHFVADLTKELAAGILDFLAAGLRNARARIEKGIVSSRLAQSTRLSVPDHNEPAPS